jgi:hypothetical protein
MANDRARRANSRFPAAKLFLLVVGLLAVIESLVAVEFVARACPFCSAVSQTFSEEIAASPVAVIARLTTAPPPSQGSALADELPKAKFTIVETLKGEKQLAGAPEFQVAFFGGEPVGTTFLAMASTDGENLVWSTPIRMDDRGRKYLIEAIKLPAEGADRLAFFQEYLEDKNEMLARDAYDEFAKAPYATVKELKERMHRDKLRAWIADPNVTPSRRRLYLTMLGVSGQAEDCQQLESLMQEKDRQKKLGLDAIIAAYLTLKGASGMPLVEDLFLKNADADYTETYAAIMALRFHGQEEQVIPREALLAGLRTMLDRPQLADLVIPDLARWEDWSAVDRLVTLFKSADDNTAWVRVPVIKYLQACPLPEAKSRLDELAKIDPEAMKRAKSFFPFSGSTAPSTKVPAGDSNPAASRPESKKKPSEPRDPQSSSSGVKGAIQAVAVEEVPDRNQELAQADGVAAKASGDNGEPAAAGGVEYQVVKNTSEAPAAEPSDLGTGEAPAMEATALAEEAAPLAVGPGKTMAAIGATPLAPGAIADTVSPVFTVWQVGGAAAISMGGIFIAMWRLLWGGQGSARDAN